MSLPATLLRVGLLGSITQLGYAQYNLLCDSAVLAPLKPNSAVQIGVSEGSGAHVQFQYAGVTSALNSPNFIIVVPSGGTTPGVVNLGLNPGVVAQMQPWGTYELSVRFTTADQSASCASVATFTAPSAPAPAIQSVVNAASLQPALSPGALVSVFGANLTGPTQSTTYDATASFPTSVANTSVTFNGTAAPLVYVSPSQFNAIVPFALAGQTTAQVVVTRFGVASTAVAVPLQTTSPGIFTVSQGGSGQGAIWQQGADGQFTLNGSTNPAPGGTALEIFATGMGVWTPAAQSDLALFGGQYFKTQPVSVTIGGQPAQVLYSGTTGGMLSSWSVLQVNAVVPSGLSTGAQPVVLKIGANDNSRQSVTVWVQ
jgi:uncharacterized protein (TIGR03437 family)